MQYQQLNADPAFPAHNRELLTFRKYTAQEKEEERNQILVHPSDILLTNFVMLELILTRPQLDPHCISDHPQTVCS